MYSIAELIKEIRNAAGLTQAQFAKAMGVSTVLIAMIEGGKKEVSKKLIIRLAKKMGVHPTSITPFIFINQNNISGVERSLIEFGEKIQKKLIHERVSRLRKYAK